MNDPTSVIECPFCGSCQTELFALFGQQLLTVQYYCNSCRTPFERVKGSDVLADAGRYTRDLTEPKSLPSPAQDEHERER